MRNVCEMRMQLTWGYFPILSENWKVNWLFGNRDRADPEI